MWVRAHEHGGLCGVDEDGGEFAGLVDAQGGGEEGALVRGEFVDGFGEVGGVGGDGSVVGGRSEIGGCSAGWGGGVRVAGRGALVSSPLACGQ